MNDNNIVDDSTAPLIASLSPRPKNAENLGNVILLKGIAKKDTPENISRAKLYIPKYEVVMRKATINLSVYEAP